MVSGGEPAAPSPTAHWVRDKPCWGLQQDRGVYASCWPLAGVLRLSSCRKRLPGTGHFCCNYIWHPPARSPDSEQPVWDCSVLQKGKRAFPLYQEHCHQLTPPRQPAVLLQLQTFLNILMEKHARVGFFFFFYFFYFFPLSNCTAARSFKASRSGAAFLCLIGNMCVCLAWRRRAWRGAGLPAWSCRGRSLWHGDGGTDPAMLTWATEPVGSTPLKEMLLVDI